MPRGPTVYRQPVGKAKPLLCPEFAREAAAVSWCLGKGGLGETKFSLKWMRGDGQQQRTPDGTRRSPAVSLGRMIELPVFGNSTLCTFLDSLTLS